MKPPADADWFVAGGDAVVVSVRVTPRASRPGIQGIIADRLAVRLQSPPVDGKANAELIALLASELGIAKSGVEILNGENARNKRLRIHGVDPGRIAGLARGRPVDGRSRRRC